jgi:DNA-binding transcriptional regulator YdaS (Cro superfamily)
MRFTLLGLAMLLSTGCAYERTQDTTANGAAGQLEFLEAYRGDLGVVPIGATRTVHVERLPGGTITCHTMGIRSRQAPGGVRALGGSGPSDTCDTIGGDSVELVSASCDDDACTVTPVAASRSDSVVLHVTGANAATTRLDVSLRSTKDGSIHTDAIGIRFAKAARVRLDVAPRDLPALLGPVLPGTPITLPWAKLVDADGTEMSLDDDAIVASLEGDAVAPDSYGIALVASAPGHATASWEVPGVIRRAIDLEVVDASQARSIVVSDSASDVSLSMDSVDLDDATAPALTPLSKVRVESSRSLFETFPTRVVLADGRRALAPLDAVSIEPAVLGTVAPDTIDPTSLAIEEAPVVGDGTLHLRVGAVTASLPISVTEPASP